MTEDDPGGCSNLPLFCAALAMGIMGGAACIAVCCGTGLKLLDWLAGAM